MAVNARISVAFPSATSYRLTADEFSGASAVEDATSTAGTGAAYSSGTAATTGGDVAFAVVALFGGTANPSWAPGWHGMSPYTVGTSHLGRAYQLPQRAGSLAAAGTGSGSWLCALVTFKP